MIKEILAERANSFEKELRSFFDTKKDLYPPTLYTAMEYSLFGGGKRIRPVIMWLVSDFLGMSFNKLLGLAIGIELIHTYSLIHDDLPSMDNDDFRRGKLTLHKMHGEANAILAGDALLNLAYETILDTVSRDNKLFLSARLIAKLAGGEGMIGGQIEDIGIQNPNARQIIEMYSKKTACLIKAAVMAPCYLYENEEVYREMQYYGENLGLIFQLTDDIIDCDNSENNSYIKIMGKDKTLQLIFELNIGIKKILEKYGKSANKLLEISEFFTTRTT